MAYIKYIGLVFLKKLWHIKHTTHIDIYIMKIKLIYIFCIKVNK
jgi:hypothetical protein